VTDLYGAVKAAVATILAAFVSLLLLLGVLAGYALTFAVVVFIVLHALESMGVNTPFVIAVLFA